MVAQTSVCDLGAALARHGASQSLHRLISPGSGYCFELSAGPLPMATKTWPNVTNLYRIPANF